MKSQSKKKKQPAKNAEDKFIAAEKYTDGGTIYEDDPNRDSPEYTEEEGISSSTETEEENNSLKTEEENENI